MNAASSLNAKLAAVLLFGLGACGGGDAPAGPERPGAEPPDQAFTRHLRVAKDQLRRKLLESAEAELESCEAIRPGDPEVLFQRARVLLAGDGGFRARTAAIERLEEALAEDPESVRAHRMLFALKLERGDWAGAATHRAAVARAYGEVGGLDLDWLVATRMRGRFVRTPPREAKPGSQSDVDLLLRSLHRLSRFAGAYAPDEAVPALEELLEKYPDLLLPRLTYALRMVTGQVRVQYSPSPGQPKASSVLIMDLGQSHVERVLDQVEPNSVLEKKAIELLRMITTWMADYDEAIRTTDMLLDWTGVDAAERRSLLMRKGLVRYKQGRGETALELLEQALEGETPGSHADLSARWLVHLARGVEIGTDEAGFPFREDLPLAGERTSLRFEDVAARMKVDKKDGASPSAWGDYDGDGDYDLYVSGCDTYGSLHRNDGEVFADVSREAGLFHVESGFGATFADYDNDGDPDLYVSRDGWSGPAPNSLHRNEGDGTFVDVTDRAGVGDGGSSFVHAWSDVDRDGDIDLYVANGITLAGDLNAFYENRGDGTFVDATERAGLLEPARTKTIGLAFGDYDLDGWPDLFVSGRETENRLYKNKGDGTFDEVADQAGIADSEHIVGGFVCFFFDYDNDGWPDVLRANQAPWELVLLGLSKYFSEAEGEVAKLLERQSPRLYRNDRDGTFTGMSAAAGLVHPNGAMGAGVADLDNDGYVDLVFGTGDPDLARMEPDRLYRNQGDGTFLDVTFAAGVGNVGKGHGITFVDHDGDGDLEIYSPEGGFVHADTWPNAFYLNRQETGNHWLQVDLEGVESNRDALDARVVVTAGELLVMREKKNGEGFGSSSSPTLEFGLGENERVDRMEVHWPSGQKQVFLDLAVDQRIYLREGEDWKPVGPR